MVKNRAEEGRVAVRNVRRDARKELEALEKAGEISRDELDRAEKDLEKATPRGHRRDRRDGRPTRNASCSRSSLDRGPPGGCRDRPAMEPTVEGRPERASGAGGRRRRDGRCTPKIGETREHRPRRRPGPRGRTSGSSAPTDAQAELDSALAGRRSPTPSPRPATCRPDAGPGRPAGPSCPRVPRAVRPPDGRRAHRGASATSLAAVADGRRPMRPSPTGGFDEPRARRDRRDPAGARGPAALERAADRRDPA